MKACPFCAGKHISTDRHSLATGRPPEELDHYAYCEDCGACGPEAHRESTAKRLWNKRTVDTGVK